MSFWDDLGTALQIWAAIKTVGAQVAAMPVGTEQPIQTPPVNVAFSQSGVKVKADLTGVVVLRK